MFTATGERRPKENPVPAKTRFLNPEALTKPAAYSQVVEVTTPGRMVFISGQIGVGRDGKLVAGDFRAQAVQAFENLKAALEAVGARFEHVVKLNNYLVGLEHQAILRDVRGRYLNMAAPPITGTRRTSFSLSRWERVASEASRVRAYGLS